MLPDESKHKPLHVGRTKEAFWRKMLALFLASGLTQVEFCKQQGISAGKFSWWKTEIRRRDAESERLKKISSKDEGFWRQMLAKFNRSGIGKDEFCIREGIRPAAFTWWRAEIGRRDVAKSSAIAIPAVAAAGMFVEVGAPKRSVPAVTNLAEKPIAEIDLQRGTVRLFENVTADSLSALFLALKEHLK